MLVIQYQDINFPEQVFQPQLNALNFWKNAFQTVSAVGARYSDSPAKSYKPYFLLGTRKLIFFIFLTQLIGLCLTIQGNQARSFKST